MSRASKYLRKKLAVGGMLDPEELKKLVNDNPAKPGTGVAGPELGPQLQQSTAQNMQEALKSFQGNNPQAQTSEPEILTQAKGRTAVGFSGRLPTPRMSNPNIAPRTPTPQQRVMTPTTQRLMDGFEAEQNQPAPSAQRPDDGMPPWMTNKQKAALKQVNAENQATMESPEYQEALQKFQDSKGQDSEAQALLEKFSGEMTAKQNAVAPQPRFTEASLMGVQGQQLQGNAPRRMAASSKTVIEKPVEPTQPTAPEGTRPPKPIREDYGAGGRGDAGYKTALAEYNNKPIVKEWTAYDDSKAKYDTDYSQFEKDLKTFQSSSVTSTEKSVIEKPDKPSKGKYTKPATPRSCSDKQGSSREACIVARRRELDAMSEWNKVEESWEKYDSDLDAFENFDPDDYTDNNNNTGNTGGNNNNNNTGNTGGNNNNTGGNVNKNDQVEGNVGSSNYTVIDKADSGAPTGINQDRPDVAAPQMQAEKITAERPVRADYTDSVDAEGNVTKTKEDLIG